MRYRRFSAFAVLVLATCLGSTFAAKDTAESEGAKDLLPKRFTPSAKQMPLSKVLAELSRQTGIRVLDRRGNGDDPTINVDLNQASFWQCVDAVAKAANAKVSLHEENGEVTLVKGLWPKSLRVCYSGLFRIAITRLVAERNLETGAHFYKATFEVAWEPRFRPLYLDTHPRPLLLQDEDGRAVPVQEEGRGQAPVEEARAMTFDVRLPAFDHPAARIRLLKGTLSVIGAARMLEFTFDSLDRLASDEKARRQTQEGVSVTVSKLVLGQDRWTVQVKLDYPPGMPKFESYQSWVTNNEIFLTREVEGKERHFPNNGNWNEDRAGNPAIISYHFIDEPKKGLKRRDAKDWKLVYRTPAAVVTVPIAFEFKDLSLP